MKKNFLRLLSLALCAALLCGCTPAASSQAGPARYSAVWYDLFDTVTTVIAYCDSQEEFDAQMEALHADLLEYHKLYDIYNEYEGINNLCTVNANAGSPVEVDDKILDMLQQAIETHQLTEGKVNVALGSVLRLWHDAREAAENGAPLLPDATELEAANAHTDITKLVLDREAGTVTLADPAMRLDVGSCGKGYACEMAARAAQSRGLASASISVGGNIRAIGTKPGNQSWTGGVQDPWNPESGGYLAAVYTSDLALVTSGNYQRYFELNGVRYHHLIDPDTLQPAGYFDSVSILCGDSGLADCLSTAVFCMPLAEGQALIESLDGVEALWCLSDGSMVESSGWGQHVR